MSNMVRTDLLSIGRTGLEAAKTQLTVTGHNIANVNTPGYTRQETTQRALYSERDNYVGAGTTVLDIRRVYSDHLTTQLRRTTSLSSEAATYQSQIEELDTVLASSTTSLSSSAQEFFSALQTAADDPANTASRQLVLANAKGVAQRFNDLYSTLSSEQDQINQQVSSTVDQVNMLAKSIGQMNATINKAIAGGDSPNDLMDQRDEAIRELSSYVSVSVVEQDQGTLNLFVGNSGHPLVVGETVNQLSTSPSDEDPSQLGVNFVKSGDGSTQVITDTELGGQLGGLIRFREEALNPSINTFGQMALAFTETVNTQLGQGLDLSGNAGSDLFGDINTSEMMTQRVVVSGNNESTVNGQLRITNANNLTSSDYDLRFDGAAYTATRVSDGATMTVTDNAGTLTFSDSQGVDQGFSVTPSGTPAANDTFRLQPVKQGAKSIAVTLTQPNQLAFAAPLKSGSTLQNTGTGSIGQPSLTAVTDTASPAQDAAMRTADLQAVSPMTLTYDSSLGELVPSLPSLPAGWSATVSPASLPVTAGQTNNLSYTLEVSDGATTTRYEVAQTFSGTPANGDTFSLSFNAGGVSDNRNALELANLKTEKIVNVQSGSSASLLGTYSGLVEEVGTLTAQARQDSDTTGALLDYAQDSRDSYSGVNLDEEAANLIKFEQYYNAAAQVIQVSREMFDTLLSSVR